MAVVVIRRRRRLDCSRKYYSTGGTHRGGYIIIRGIIFGRDYAQSVVIWLSVSVLHIIVYSCCKGIARYHLSTTHHTPAEGLAIRPDCSSPCDNRSVALLVASSTENAADAPFAGGGGGSRVRTAADRSRRARI